MALRPGGGIAHEAFLHARAQARGHALDPFATTLVHPIGSLLVATDLRYRLIGVAVVAGDGGILVAKVGADEWRDYLRAQNRKPAARRAVRRYDKGRRRLQRARA